MVFFFCFCKDIVLVYSHIFREENSCADLLANYGVDWWDHITSLGVNSLVIGQCFPITYSDNFLIGFWPSPSNLFIFFLLPLMLFGVIFWWICMGVNLVGMHTLPS